MKRELIENLHQYFEEKESLTPDETYYFLQLKEEIEYFQIGRLHRDDLTNIGFEGEGLCDSTVAELSEMLRRDYCEQLMNQSLEIIAGEMKIPKCSKGYTSSKYNNQS